MSEHIFNKYVSVNNEFYRLYKNKYNRKLNYNVLAYAVFELSAIKGVYPDDRLFDDMRDVDMFGVSNPIFSSVASDLVQEINIEDMMKELRMRTDEILNLFYQACKAKTRRIDYKYNVDSKGNIELSYGFSKFNVNSRIVEKLRRMHTGKNFAHDLKRLIMRYAPLVQGSAVNCQASFIEDFDITFEMFASPFNVNEQHKYFALYAEDKVFGSLGNFFVPDNSYSTTLNLNVDEVYQCNPVFSDKLLHLTAERIMELGDRNYKILVVMPHWIDSAGVEMLKIKYPYKIVENDLCLYVPGDVFKHEEDKLINIGSATILFGVNM